MRGDQYQFQVGEEKPAGCLSSLVVWVGAPSSPIPAIVEKGSFVVGLILSIALMAILCWRLELNSGQVLYGGLLIVGISTFLWLFCTLIRSPEEIVIPIDIDSQIDSQSPEYPPAMYVPLTLSALIIVGLLVVLGNLISHF